MTTDPTGSGPWDRGLQVERTALAWQRTALAAAVAALVALRGAVLAGSAAAAVLAISALLAASVAAGLAGRDERSRTRELRSGGPLPAPRAALPLAASVVLLALAVLVDVAT